MRSCAAQHPELIYATLVTLIASLILLLLYRAALPKSFPGIPYNAASALHVLGDVPAMLSHIANEDGTFISYLIKTLEELEAPLVQVFIKPFGKPLLILSDYREAHDMMVHRTKEFDRSTSSGDLVRGLGPNHHIHLKTTPAWRAQRRLIQDLMTPSFLNNVAAPALHQKACDLLDLWRIKTRIADGRPWAAAGDIDNVSLDAVVVFAFGQRFVQAHSALQPAIEAIQSLGKTEIESIVKSDSLDDPITFPEGEVDKVLSAILELVETVQEMQGSPLPDLKWAYVNRKPQVRRAAKIKEDYIRSELKDALGRLQGTEEEFVKFAIDHMVLREKVLAEKDGRIPDYFSRVMIDEIFGFVIAGNDTSSTAISWSLKYFAENITSQTALRNALEMAFPQAVLKDRVPTIQEITGAHIPYLDATIEETLRCGASVPVVDRQAVVDTELLGYRVPKGTVVTCLVTGPSMTTPAFSIDKAWRNRNGNGINRRGFAWDVKDMAAFKPERWLTPGNGEFDGVAGPQLAFGLGTRQCFGKRLDHLEMRIIIALIIWSFELLPCPQALSGYKSVLVMTNRPKDCYPCLAATETRT
ncbi:hypothetical protein CHU98_g9246 [Xylaria longipes]|nr:hypothetical protein CHU98_g9246 [Xylaria longipes]